MRLWNLTPAYLATGLLLREHQSIHRHLNLCLESNKSSTPYWNYVGYLIWRHYLDVIEMRHRGFEHRSFVDKLWLQIDDDRRRMDFPIKSVAVAKDKRDLINKRQKARSSHSDDASIPVENYRNELESMQKHVIRNGLPKEALLL